MRCVQHAIAAWGFAAPTAAAPAAAAPAAAAPAAPAAPAATPAAEPSPSWLTDIPWTTLIIVAVVIAVLAVAIWLFLRWRRKRATAPRPTSPVVADQLAAGWTRFYRDLPARARHFPTVIVVGEAGGGKSHLIDSRVDWRAQANQFFPSSVDSPHLQLYLGSSLVVHELSAPILRDITPVTRRALARLWRNLGPSATFVVVVDARSLSTTPPDTLRELAQLVRGKISALPARCRERAEVRVCLSHMDQIDGYDELAAVLGPHHGPLDAGALGDRLDDPAAVAAAARAVIASYDGNLAYGLAHRPGDGFAKLVGFYATFPVLLAQLAPLLRSLAGSDPDQPHHPVHGLFLGSIAPESHVGDPFAVDRSLVAASIAQQRRRHRRASIAIAATGATAVGVLTLWHGGRVDATEAAVASYHQVVRAGRAGEPQVRRVGDEFRRLRHAEHLWLDRTFVERKRDITARFASDLRDQYLLPRLRVQTINRSTMLYIIGLLYASDGNGLGPLIRDNLALWATRLGVSATVISAYLDASPTQYETAVSFDPVYTGSDWPGYVFDKVKPVYEQTGRITQAQLDDLQRDPPLLYDDREYGMRRGIVDLISAQLALATQPSIARLLASPLGASEWTEANVVPLDGIQAAITRSRLSPTSPRTLGELGADLQRMLVVPARGPEVHRVSQVRNGITEPLAFDVTAWNAKLAASSAARTIAAVRDRNLSAPEQAIGFFAADDAPRGVGAITGPQGPAVALPGRYTAAEFTQKVAPALDFITTRASGLGLSVDEQAALSEIYLAQINDYAGRYVTALRAYYDSFRFEPGGEQSLPFALAQLVQPASWFQQFLTTVASNAAPPLGDGAYYAVMSASLTEFRPLVDLLAPAKGTLPGLAPYQLVITDLVTALDPSKAAPPAADAPATLATTLSPAGALALGKLSGTDKDRRAQVSGWLTGANVERSLHAPFLAPVDAAYALGRSDLDRAVGRAWSADLAPVVAPILARFPFHISARSDASVGELEAVLRAQGKQPGTFWAGFQRWLGPVTVQRNQRYHWLDGVSGPAGALATINDLARLSRALWDGDGNPAALPIVVIPQPLDAGPAGGRVPTLAYLRSGASAVYAFNQRPGPNTLALPWWDQGTSSIILTMSKPGSADAATYSIDEANSPFSFFRLLCRARGPARSREPPTTGCDPGRGVRTWDIPLDATTTRSITLTLDTDPWALFQIGH